MAAESAAMLQAVTEAELSIATDRAFESPSARAAVVGADAVISPQFPRALADVAASVRMVHSTGAGVELIDPRAVALGVPICNCEGHARAMAEYALGAMICLSRNLAAADRFLRDGDWRYGASFGPPKGVELRGREVLVIGAGEAAKDLVPMLAVLGMAVTVATRTPARALTAFPAARAVIRLDGLTSALPSADFVVLAVPLTPATTGLIGKQQLEAMKRSAILVNMARSLVVDEASLFDALVNDGIAAAALDVWTRRPAAISERLGPSPHDFASLDNVLLTPHFAGWTHESQATRWRNIAQNVDRLAAGKPVLNVVAVGEGNG